MQKLPFELQLPNNTVVFTDYLEINKPCIYPNPRDFESLFIVTEGTMLQEIGDERYFISKGQVGYIPNGTAGVSAAYDCERVSYIAVNFSTDIPNYNKGALPLNVLCSTTNSSKYLKLFTQMLKYFSNKTPACTLICNGILYQIVGFLYDESVLPQLDTRKVNKLSDSVEYLKNNYGNQNLKISHLAEIANVSEKHFRRLFFDVYNQTPRQFLQELRIDNAKILLTNTNKSISDIAEICGFADVYSFSHCFKRQTGVAPNKYSLEK